MRILQLTAHFSPNLGGVETHLDDLVAALVKRKHKVFVLTYRPIETRASWKLYQSKSNLQVLRIPWIRGLFYKLVKIPILEFLYLMPGFFTVAPFVILVNNPDVIHAHGLVAGFTGVFWGKIFGKRVIVATHSIYHFPKTGAYRKFVKWLFNNSDYVMGLSKQAVREIRLLGINREKSDTFTYWIDLQKFKTQKSKLKAKEKLGWGGKFVVLFVGRLIPEKGINELLEAAKIWDRNINLAIAGSGPLESKIQNTKYKIQNLIFLGKIPNDKLSPYYSAADLVIIPSIHDEGFGRVILESLASGTPVIGARRGAIPEAMDETVGTFIEVNPKNIKNAVEHLYKNPDKLKKLAKKARRFAERRYSERNVEKIIKAYGD